MWEFVRNNSFTLDMFNSKLKFWKTLYMELYMENEYYRSSAMMIWDRDHDELLNLKTSLTI